VATEESQSAAVKTTRLDLRKKEKKVNKNKARIAA